MAALVSTYQAFNRYASEDIKRFELTMTQFDLIATLQFFITLAMQHSGIWVGTGLMPL